MRYISFIAPVTDQSVQRLLEEIHKAVAAKETSITVLFSTPGSNVSSGITAFNSLKVLEIKKIFWNIGNIDSIGVMMFLAGDERYAVPNSRYLLHDVKWGVSRPGDFTEGELGLTLDSVIHDRNAIANLSAAVTVQPVEVIADMMVQGKTWRLQAYTSSNILMRKRRS